MAPEMRTYGNWRRPVSAGLGSFGTIGTVILLAGLIVTILMMVLVGLLGAMVFAVLGGLGLSTLVIRGPSGRTLLQAASARLGFWRGKATGANLYRSGPLGRTEWGTYHLPGLAAASELYEYCDGWERPFALIRMPSRGHYTVVFLADPDGASLVDEEQVDQWVAHWGQWLATLADEPGVIGVSVTIETTPDSGTRLWREVDSQLDPSAPQIAQAMLQEVVDTYPAGSAQIRAMVAITFGVAGRRPVDEVAHDLAARLPYLGQALAPTGAGLVRPMGAQTLCEAIRTAYEPGSARIFDAARLRGEVAELTWHDVGPAAHQADWGTYRHDDALSVTWAMSMAPRGEVTSGVLQRFLRPHTDIDRKRVTLLYRPIDSAGAARIVEQDKRNADFRVNNGTGRPSARAIAEQRAASLTAQEEARGAGLVNFALLATATVTSPERLEAARQAMEHIAPTARLRMRVMYGSQDSAFAACLPLGIVLRSHLRVPDTIRESL